MRDTARYAALRALITAGGVVPPRVLEALAAAAGTLAWMCSARVRTVTRDHMRHVLGSVPRTAIDRAARGCARTTARYYVDFARTAHDKSHALDELRAVDGIDHFFAAYDRGCGVVLLSAHLGNPEALAGALGALGLPLLIITEPLRPPHVHELVHRARAAPGVHFVPASLTAVREALTHLRAGGIVAILGDRDVLGTGTDVPFFGERASLPSGAIELALRTGAPVVPAFVIRQHDGGFRAVLLPPLDLPRTGHHATDTSNGLLLAARALESGIRLAPEQWFPLQPVWTGLHTAERG